VGATPPTTARAKRCKASGQRPQKLEEKGKKEGKYTSSGEKADGEAVKKSANASGTKKEGGNGQ